MRERKIEREEKENQGQSYRGGWRDGEVNMKETFPYQIQHFIRILGVHAVVIPPPLRSQMPFQFAYEKPKADHDHQQSPIMITNKIHPLS